jgi:hypothetical protein
MKLNDLHWSIQTTKRQFLKSTLVFNIVAKLLNDSIKQQSFSLDDYVILQIFQKGRL